MAARPARGPWPERRRADDQGLLSSWSDSCHGLLVASLVILAFLAATLATPALARDKREALLPEKHRQWLATVEFLISKEERETFLELEKDYQRDAFIERFWKTRDPFPDTGRNEFREQWEARLETAAYLFENLKEDRARYFLMNGPPDSQLKFDCTNLTWPLEVWFYDGSERLTEEFFLIFYQRYGLGPLFLWHPIQGLGEILTQEAAIGGSQVIDRLQACRDGDYVARVLRFMLRNRGMDFEFLVARIERPVETPSGEWLATFSAYSTDLPPDAEALPASLEVEFPHRHQSRTVVQTTIEVKTEEAGMIDLAGHKAFNFFLTGEILRQEQLFENFRYKFDFSVAEITGESIPMLFQRRLRPGVYRLIVKLEDLNSKRIFRAERELDVPRAEGAAPTPIDDPETARILAEANAAISNERPTVKIVAPQDEMLTGMVRFDTFTTGSSITEVRFAVDGRRVLTRKKAPFTVELDLGAIPRSRVLRVSAHDADGRELAADELSINAGRHRFAVNLVEPRRGVTYSGRLEAEARVDTPEGVAPQRVEFYLNEALVATLYQPPYVQSILIPAQEEMAYVRTVAYLADGNSTEDLVFVNAPDYLEEIDVEFVELYTTVLDRQGRPILGLARGDFKVAEDGVEQEVLRFETVHNLPIHTEILLDVSASMEENLSATQKAALRYFEQALTPKDRAAIITFNNLPHLAVKFTNELSALAGGLAGLKANGGTALYDSLVFALYHLNGIRGQRAILLLSDGRDESSRFAFEDSLDYARRAGVVIYAIGLNITGKSEGAKKKLTQFADETGGRSFFIKGVEELPAIYDQIQEELRSRYLLAYQSTNASSDGRFRSVDVRISRSGLEAKTLRGYYP